jgi:hypothetical protein
LDGSRGGQAFICKILLPEEGGQYGIEEQARMQMLSVMLVAAGLMDRREDFQLVMEEEFGVSSNLGIVFNHLYPALRIFSLFAMAFAFTVCYSLLKKNLFGDRLAYAVQFSSLIAWAIGATGLLMMGGNPRVTIIRKALPNHILARLPSLDYNHKDDIELEFGSFHGSIFTSDRGTCSLPPHVVHSICQWDLEFARSRTWLFGMVWFIMLLLLSVILQVAGSSVSTLWSDIIGIVVLLVTSILRGVGISAPEEWQIPRWKRRVGATYGATLVGAVVAR